MIEYFGDDTTMWILPDGDFVHGRLVKVDTTDWTLEDFRQFDNCPADERAGLANLIAAIRATYDMSVVEITVKRK